MYNLKLTAYAIGAGFIISILAGIIGGVSFGALLLHALVWGIVCGGVVTGSYAIYKSFLVEDMSNDSFDNGAESADKGQHVDIILDDEPLPDDASAPEFSINNMGKSKPFVNIKAREVESVLPEESAEPTAFKAMPLNGVTKSPDIQEFSEATEFVDSPVPKSESVYSTDSSGIGDLPDIDSVMGDIDGMGEDLKDGNSSSNLIEDSDFATSDTDPKLQQHSKDAVSSNANEMARAIRSVLANDS